MAVSEARTEARIRRRAAQLEAARQEREEAELAARHLQVAQMVNRPFLAAVEHWTDPEILSQQPAARISARTDSPMPCSCSWTAAG